MKQYFSIIVVLVLLQPILGSKVPTGNPTFTPSIKSSKSQTPTSFTDCNQKFIISTYYKADNRISECQFDSSGVSYVISREKNIISTFSSSTGVTKVIAGQYGISPSSAMDANGDGGRADSALFDNPWNLVFDSKGNMFVSDDGSNKIRKIASGTYTITTIAGTGKGSFSGDGGSAISATLGGPKGLYMDTSDKLYVAESLNHRIRRVNIVTGIISTIAGASLTSNDGRYSGDNGKATSAYLNTPKGVWGDSVGNILIADTANHLIRKVTVSTGIITTVAGLVVSGAGSSGYNGNGMAATSSKLQSPSGVWIDSVGDYYIADQGNNLIRKLYVSSGTLVNLVGTAQQAGYSGDNGPSTSASLSSPISIIGDSKGNLYVSDYSNKCIRKLTSMCGASPTASPSKVPILTATPTSIKSNTIAPTPTYVINPSYYYFDKPSSYPTAEKSSKPSYSPTIKSTLSPTALTSNFPTAKSTSRTPSLLPTNKPSRSPSTCPSNAPNSNPTFRPTKIPTNLPSTISPTIVPSVGLCSGEGIITTYYNSSCGTTSIWIDNSGDAYLTDTANDVVVKIDASTGKTGVFVGSYGIDSSSLPIGDGNIATAALLYRPWGVIADTVGNIFISDQANNRIRKVAADTGFITTIAGSGNAGYEGDYGQATSANLNYPEDMWLDTNNQLYFAATRNNRIRMVNLNTGIIVTIAGKGTDASSGDYSGDGGPATSADLQQPRGVWGDSNGIIYIADTFNHLIRTVSTSTIINTIAGDVSSTSVGGYNGDNIPATSALLLRPSGVWVDSSGNIFIADQGNNAIRKVASATGLISTVAGKPGFSGYNGDEGSSYNSLLFSPINVYGDTAGSLYISDFGNKAIRKVSYPCTVNPTSSPSVSGTVALKTSIPTYSQTTTLPTSAPTFNPSRVPTTKPSCTGMGMPISITSPDVSSSITLSPGSTLYAGYIFTLPSNSGSVQ
eukprot:gene10680-14343_t